MNEIENAIAAMNEEDLHLFAHIWVSNFLRQATAANCKAAIFSYKGKYMFGDFKLIFPLEDHEIILANHTSYRFQRNFINACLAYAPQLAPILLYDDELDIAPNQNIVRKRGTQLSRLTPEQTAFVQSKNFSVYQNDGQGNFSLSMRVDDIKPTKE